VTLVVYKQPEVRVTMLGGIPGLGAFDAPGAAAMLVGLTFYFMRGGVVMVPSQGLGMMQPEPQIWWQPEA
jgi:hypothetical protein